MGRKFDRIKKVMSDLFSASFPIEETLDATLNEEAVKHRAVSGVLILTARRFVLQIVSFTGSIFLARTLTPQIFGIFGIVSFIISFFAFFSDVGLAGALIQKKDKVSRLDLTTTFTIQTTLVMAVLLVVMLISPFLVKVYKLSDSAIWLIRALSFSLLLTNLKVIPSVLLERKLDFNRLVVPEIVEIITFNAVAVVLAFKGLAVWSLIWAVLARGGLGLITIYILQPWLPSFSFDLTAAKSLFRFGVPYQLNGLLTMAKDTVTPVYLGAILGAAAVGFVNWASTFVAMPGQLVGVVGRVAFPVYSRIQDNIPLLKKAIEKSLRMIAFFVYPILVLMIVLAPQIVTIVYTNRWTPALPLIYWLAAASFYTNLNSVLVNALYAIGKAGTALKLMFLWTVLTWVFTVPLIYKFGFLGVAVAQFLVAISSLITVWEIKKTVPIEIVKNIKSFGLAALFCGVTAFVLSQTLIIDNLLMLIFVGGLSGIIYLVGLYLLEGELIIGDIKKVVGVFLKK